MTYHILDLFAGAAGLSLGFELFKDDSGRNVFELYRAVEAEKYACDTLRARYGEEKVIKGDLTDDEVHERIIKECKGIVSIVIGGIPCQSFSYIGPRSGFGKKLRRFKNDERDHLYREFKKIVKEIIPKIVVIENVKGILSKKDTYDKKIIDKLIYDFEAMGYTFKNTDGGKYFLLNAADYGVPQRRERVILIGVRKDWKNIEIPEVNPTHYDPKSGEVKNHTKDGLMPYVTLFDAIGDLPRVKPKITTTDIKKKDIAKIKVLNSRIYNGEEKVPFDEKRFKKHLTRTDKSGKEFLQFVRANGYPYIDHHVARSQQLSDIKLFRHMRQGETAEGFFTRKPALAKKLIKYKMETFTDKYRKQRWTKPCSTVFAHLEKDGNRFIHPSQARTITPREAARIQSFPDDFVFCGPISKKFKQIGNAVPPLMAYNISKAIHKILDE